MIQYDIIRRPWVTEKTNDQKEAYNQFTFEVDKDANRVEIKRAVETIFNVRVASVRTMHVKGKTTVMRRRRQILGKLWIRSEVRA